MPLVHLTSIEIFNIPSDTHIPSDSPNSIASRFVVKAFVTEPIPNKVSSVTGSVLSKSVTPNPFCMATCPWIIYVLNIHFCLVCNRFFNQMNWLISARTSDTKWNTWNISKTPAHMNHCSIMVMAVDSWSVGYEFKPFRNFDLFLILKLNKMNFCLIH